MRRNTLRRWWPGLVLALATQVGCGAPATGQDSGLPDSGHLDGGLGDSGQQDSGEADSGEPDSGVSDGGLLDAGANDAGAPDGGLPDAGANDAGGTDAGSTDAGVLIDFAATSAAFPPTVNKIGFNSFWNSASNDGNFDAWTMRRSAHYRSPMISGLIEPKSLTNVMGFQDSYEEWDGDKTAAQLDAQSCTLWQQQSGYSNTLFFNNAGSIEARKPTDPDLTSLRDTAKSYGLINFLQVSGTPGTILPVSTSLFNGLFTLVGTHTTGGNWYPLPANSDFPTLAHTFGTLPDAVGYATPTIYSFWQEPSHTIDESLNATDSINKYANLYWQIANQVATQCRWQHCPMAGAQLNANDGDQYPITVPDGHRYKLFIDTLQTRRANNPGLDIPLDYFTVQNYGAQLNDNIVANTRIALGTAFDWTPVLMNEWDYCVNPRTGDGCTSAVGSFTKRYDGPDSLAALHWLLDSIDRPDVSHVLLREKVLQDQGATAGTYSYPWTQVPILFLASMSEFRRPAVSPFAAVQIVASGDDDQLHILLWNEGNNSKTLALTLTNLPAALLNKSVSVKKISKAIRDTVCPGSTDVMDGNDNVTCWQDAIAPTVISGATLTTAPITIAPGEATMVFAGTPPTYASSLFPGNFVRSSQLVKRTGTAAAPRGMAHFDPRTDSITVATQSGGDAAGKVVLKNLSNTLAFTTRVASQGTLSAATVVAGVRVDYLDVNHAPIKSVFFRDDRWPTAAAPWNRLEWPTTGAHSEVATNLCGTGCTNGSGATVTLDLLANAPAGWATSKDVAVGVVLSGTASDAIYRVDLP